MDQGAIYTMKYHYLYLQYGRILKYVIDHPNDSDPLKKFYKSYSLLDAIYDIALAWEHVSKEVLHKCFEEILPVDQFMEAYNYKNGIHLEWPKDCFR